MFWSIRGKLSKWLIEWRENGHNSDSVYDFLIWLDKKKFRQIEKKVLLYEKNPNKAIFNGDYVFIVATLAMIEGYKTEAKYSLFDLINRFYEIFVLVDAVRKNNVKVEGDPTLTLGRNFTCELM